MDASFRLKARATPWRPDRPDPEYIFLMTCLRFLYAQCHTTLAAGRPRKHTFHHDSLMWEHSASNWCVINFKHTQKIKTTEMLVLNTPHAGPLSRMATGLQHRRIPDIRWRQLGRITRCCSSKAGASTSNLWLKPVKKQHVARRLASDMSERKKRPQCKCLLQRYRD